MLRLDSTLRKLEVLLGGTVTTTPLAFVASWADATSTGYVGGTTPGTVNGAGVITAVAAPLSGTIRDVDYFSIFNLDSVPATVTVRLNDNGSLYPLITVALPINCQLRYTHADGWGVIDALGNLKAGFQGLTGASGPSGPATYLEADPLEAEVLLFQGPPGLAGITGAQGPQGNSGQMWLDCPDPQDDSGVSYSAGAANSLLNQGFGFTGFRNRIINGDMRIDQRNNGAAVTPAATAYTIDRFEAVISQASKLTFQQVVDAPPGFKFSTKISVAAQFSPGVGDFFTYTQPIEGQNIIDFQFGLATAQQVTASFWIKGSVAGTYSVALVNLAGTQTYVGTVSVTASWVKQSITLTGSTTGVWPTDNTGGLFLSFDLGSGSNFNTTAGAWQAGNFRRTAGSVTFVNQANGSTLNLAGVMVELGTVATPFEQRPIGVELALCQRYTLVFGTVQFIGNGTMRTGATNAYMVVPTPATMRAAPTITSTGTIQVLVGDNAGTVSVFGASILQANAISFVITNGATGAANAAGVLYTNNGTITFSAEL